MEETGLGDPSIWKINLSKNTLSWPIMLVYSARLKEIQMLTWYRPLQNSCETLSPLRTTMSSSYYHYLARYTYLVYTETTTRL